jgi:hypothetical protein
LQIIRQCLPDIMRQRQSIHAGTLAAHQQFSSPPVYFVQSQMSDFARAQTQSGQQ